MEEFGFILNLLSVGNRSAERVVGNRDSVVLPSGRQCGRQWGWLQPLRSIFRLIRRLPVLRQQLVHPRIRMGLQAQKDVGEVLLRVDSVGLSDRGKSHCDSEVGASVIVTNVKGVLPQQGHDTQRFS